MPSDVNDGFLDRGPKLSNNLNYWGNKTVVFPKINCFG